MLVSSSSFSKILSAFTADSKVRTVVVPTAIIFLPSFLALFSLWAVASSIT